MNTNANITGNSSDVYSQATETLNSVTGQDVLALLGSLGLDPSALSGALNTLGIGADGGLSNGVSVVNPAVRTANQLANELGINLTYDYDKIKAIYDDATIAANKASQESSAVKSYYQLLGDAQSSAMDTMRKAYSSAVSNGATRGMQAANMLSTILGTTQQANEQATQLAQQRQLNANEYASQLAQNAKDALEYSNSMQNNISTLSRQLYNDDIQRQTAELGYNQQINTDRAGYNANVATQLAGMLNNRATAAAGLVNNNQTALANIQAAIEAANATKYAAANQHSTQTTTANNTNVNKNG